VGSRGVYCYVYLDDSRTEPDLYPFLLRVENHWARLGLVRAGSPHDMTEFFVTRKYRRTRVGRARLGPCSTCSTREWDQAARRKPAGNDILAFSDSRLLQGRHD